MGEGKFSTERTRQLRASELDERETLTVNQIEEFGCSIMHVRGEIAHQNWSYTIGAFDTATKAELITVGLKVETAASLLNEAVDRMRSGVDLGTGRHQDLVGEVDCEFRPVDRKWLRQLMGWAVWFNDGDDFPVLQAIYPDLENRFQDEEGFTEYFRQPLLQPGIPMGRLEDDLWASNDPSSSLFDWTFPDPPHTVAYLSKTVQSGEEAVTYVAHDHEGDWQFLGDLMSEGGGPVISCLHHPIDSDPTLKECPDLPRGWYAEREAVGAPWVRGEKPPEEEEEPEVD